MRAAIKVLAGAQETVRRARDAFRRARLARIERRIRQTEAFLARELDMHAEQMLWLRAELQRLRELRIVQAGEARCYTSGALQ